MMRRQSYGRTGRLFLESSFAMIIIDLKKTLRDHMSLIYMVKLRPNQKLRVDAKRDAT